MKKILRFTPFLLLVLALGVYLSGCINYDQKTSLNKDGSGTMKIHYWTVAGVDNKNDMIHDFPFSEAKIKDFYGSGNTEISDIKIDHKFEKDTTKHVNFTVKFKDISKISDVKGFNGVKATWAEGKEGMDFKYVVLKDTSKAKGGSSYKLTYEFEFPDEIISTNGNKDGKKVNWYKTLDDLKSDIEMTATIKSEKKKCGLFGMELPIVILAGLTYMTFRRKK